MPNPTPLPRVIHIPCRKCGATRHHLGTGVCRDCMTPAEREKYGTGDEKCTACDGHGDIWTNWHPTPVTCGHCNGRRWVAAT